MADIVERLRRKVFKNPQVGAPHERTVEWQAADEIERLREALRGIAEDQEGDYDFIVWQARAALGKEK